MHLNLTDPTKNPKFLADQLPELTFSEEDFAELMKVENVIARRCRILEAIRYEQELENILYHDKKREVEEIQAKVNKDQDNQILDDELTEAEAELQLLEDSWQAIEFSGDQFIEAIPDSE